MKMKKIISIALALVLAIGMLAGCGGGSTSEAAKNFSETDEKLTIQWLGYATLGGCSEGTNPELILEEAFNVDIKPLFYENTNFNDKKTMLMAGGEIPDLVYELDPVNVYNDVDQDFIVEVPYETVEKYAPSYYNFLNEYCPAAWGYSRYMDANWGIPNLNYFNEYPMAHAYRTDWLKKVGKKAPTTIEEMHDVLAAFVNEDPDGNGKDDTFGYSTVMSAWSYFFPEIFGAYGVLPFNWQEIDGEITYGGLREETAEVLQVLADWYKEGLIHPDFAIGTSQSTLVTTNKIGFIQMVAYQDEANETTTLNTLRQTVPEADYTYVANPYGPDGLRGNKVWGAPCHVVSFGMTEQYGVAVPRILQMFERIFTDEEFMLSITWGEEGKTYVVDDKKTATADTVYRNTPDYVDSNARRLAGITNSISGPSFFAPITPSKESYMNTMSDKYREWRDTYSPADAAMADVFYKVDIVPSAAEYLGDLRNKQMKLMADIIQGIKPADSYIPEFTEMWTKGGGDILLEEARAHQDVMQKMYKELGVK